MPTFVVKDSEDNVLLKMEAKDLESVPTSISKEEADNPLNLADYAEALAKMDSSVKAIASRMGYDTFIEKVDGEDEEPSEFRKALAQARERNKARGDAAAK